MSGKPTDTPPRTIRDACILLACGLVTAAAFIAAIIGATP